MGGFERFTVIEPATSREVRLLVRDMFDHHQAVPLVLVAEASPGVTPLRETKLAVKLRIDHSSINAEQQLVCYTGTTEEGATMALTVHTAQLPYSPPATATIVGRTNP